MQVNTSVPYPPEKKMIHTITLLSALLLVSRDAYGTTGHQESITAPQGLRRRAREWWTGEAAAWYRQTLR